MALAHATPAIDLVILTRDDSPLHPEVEQGIACQSGVHLTVHRVIGQKHQHDENRWSVIARARNEGKRRGRADWLMFLDDDVVLAPDCVAQLWNGLNERPYFAALGADYLNESRGQICCPHVAMGAVLFRRPALDQIEFRWTAGHCECLCCCRDLRRRLLGIGYLPEARACHISIGQHNEHFGVSAASPDEPPHSSERPQEYVLAAFDRRHRQKFQYRFLSSLRAAGNSTPVLAFAYGHYPAERRAIERLPGVEAHFQPSNGIAVAIRRLFDFQRPLERLPGNAIVAYWDAGDVIFQDSLSELWHLVRNHPDRLLVAAEPFAHPENGAVAKWTLSIDDAEARQRAFDLLSTRPYLNAGFAAATAATMLRYLREAHTLRNSSALRGTTDWGDQTAMNLYCHSNPHHFLAVDDRWNYCLCGRNHKEFQLLREGRFVRKNGRTISVVHGNAGTLKPFAFRNGASLARAAHSTKLLV